MTEILANVPVVTTPRLVLRHIARDDLDAVYAFHGDPRAMRYWSFPAWTDRAQADAWFDERGTLGHSREHYPWGVERRDEEGLIGALTLFQIDRVQRRCEVGYIFNPAHWGRGYAAEALRAALAHAFDVLELARVEADIDPRNDASCRLVEKIGFRREGVLRERWRVNGEVCDSAIYGLLARELVACNR
ncbi:GNAT family N-acetyltransferase [Tahibacter soli]|uniref:GNAT family N-acetyltransferase n=1 Tax=Tahibacter soli TaxID=2983605 RepID=A0A9X3YK35_9GAMM|nr:GNAT family N-acetyltransferase [Tahibacter soli]MDC8013836.1 GNAT family N-acetyltransferase [Tahibacter soli]